MSGEGTWTPPWLTHGAGPPATVGPAAPPVDNTQYPAQRLCPAPISEQQQQEEDMKRKKKLEVQQVGPTLPFPETYGPRAAEWQGDRDTMEDRVVIERQPTIEIFAVFDGHGGTAVSEHLTRTFVPAMLALFSASAAAGASASVPPPSFEHVANAILQLDAEIARTVEASEDCGSTGSAAIWLKNRHELVLINVGDSRTVVLADDYTVITSTHDHKPAKDSAEEKRILQQGGSVMHDDEVDVHRVDYNLAMSRAFGDFGLKGGRRKSNGLTKATDMLPSWNSYHVLALPEIQVIEIPKDAAPWIWLASDGLWDVVRNEELPGFTYRMVTANLDVVQLLTEIKPRNTKFEADNTTVLAGRLVDLSPHTSPPNTKTQYKVIQYDTIHVLQPAPALPPPPSVPAGPAGPAAGPAGAPGGARAAVGKTNRRRRQSRGITAAASVPTPPTATGPTAASSKAGGGRRRRASRSSK